MERRVGVYTDLIAVCVGLSVGLTMAHAAVLNFAKQSYRLLQAVVTNNQKIQRDIFRHFDDQCFDLGIVGTYGLR